MKEEIETQKDSVINDSKQNKCNVCNKPVSDKVRDFFLSKKSSMEKCIVLNIKIKIRNMK